MILLSDHTTKQINKLVEHPPHGLLFSGPEGAGKAYAAKYFARLELGLDSVEALETYPYFKSVKPEKNSLTIDQIREIQRFLQLKTPGRDGIRRIVIIEDAHYMTIEAQNALLKSLEEPPADTIIILTAPATLKLKDTIYSRVQQVPILPISKAQAIQHFATFPSAEVDKAYVMSGGQPGLLSALLHDEEHILAGEIQHAKRILGETRFQRLANVDEISKQKEALPRFLQACKIICSAAMHSAAQKQNAKQLKQWHIALDAIYQAEASLPRNPNTKLLLTDLMLQL
jgi:hypothetical protein